MGFFDKISNLADKAGQFVLQTVIGAPARQLISFGLDIADPILEKVGAKTTGEYKPEGIAKVFLGDEPVKAKSKQVKEAQEGKGTLGIKGPAGVGILAGLGVLDVLPIAGPGKSATKKALKAIEEIVDTAVPYERKFKDILDQTGLKSTRELLKTENRFGKQGKEIAKKVDLMREEATLNKAHDIVGLSKSLKTLTKEELNNFTSVAEGAGEAMNDKVKNAFEAWDNVRTKIANASEELGLKIKKADGTEIPFTPRKDFFPHVVPRAVINELVKSSSKRATFFQKMVENGSAKTVSEAESIFRKYIQSHTTKKYGHLEKAREVDFPLYERDPRKVLFDYVAFAHDRLAQAKYFGASDEFAKEAFETMRKTGKDYEMAERIFNRIVGNEINDPIVQKISAYARTYEVVTKLGLGAITNLGQFVNTAVRTGLVPALKAQTEAIFSASGREFAQRAGNVRQIIQEQVQLAGGDTDIAEKFLKWVQFQRVEVNNRTVAALAGRNYARTLFKNLQKIPESSREGSFAFRRLKALGIDPKKSALSANDLLKAGYNTIKDSQFSANAEDLPFYWGSPTGRVFTQFKSFAFNQASFMKKFVYDEMKQGNVKPLIVYAVVGEAMGEVIGDIKAKARDRERPEGIERVIDNLLTIGGLGILTDFYQALRFGTLTGGSQLFSFIAGPAISDLMEITQDIGSLLIEGEGKPLKKKALRSIPVIGAYTSQQVYPTNQKYRARGGFLPEALFQKLQGTKKTRNLPGTKSKNKKLPGIKAKSKSLPGL